MTQQHILHLPAFNLLPFLVALTLFGGSSGQQLSQDVQHGNGMAADATGEGGETEGHVGARTLAELGLCVPVCIYVGSSCYFHHRGWGNVLLVRSFP